MIDNLTAWEKRVLSHVVQGKETKDIAQEMNMTYNQVKNMRQRIRQKTGYGNMIQLAYDVGKMQIV